MSTTRAILTSTTVEIDGQQIGPGCRGYRLDVRGGPHEGPAILTLDLMVEPVEFEGRVTVIIPEPTRAALEALGWTPPPKE